jgi:glycosyltransferase involved in cell wall biosynthesis
MRSDWDLMAARRIRSRVKAWNADVLHAHDARSHALGIGALLGRTVPLIVTRRVAFTPRSVRIKYGGRVSRFIAISNAVRDAMVAGGIDASRIDVVHSGILMPTGQVAPRDWRTELGWPADAIVCGMVGAMTKEKGLDVLENILGSMSAAARATARLVLLGGEARGHMEMGGVPVFSPGFVSGIEEAVAGLDVLLHPSNLEGLGTSVIDAMAVGVPPVAFAVGGLPEVIVDGQSGLLVRPGSVADFAAAAERLILDRGLRHMLGAGAVDRAKTFSAEAMTKGTEAVYQGVLAG